MPKLSNQNYDDTYDAIGNPLFDGTWTYTWQAGRQLKQMSKSGTTVQFKYDHNGLRTQKVATVNGSAVTTNYVLHGKLLVHMTQGSDKLHFFYDAQSRPVFVEYNATKYVYVLNLQGDIVALLDVNGATMVEYKYDAWGKPISTTGTMASTLGKLNPFRYRDYVYDEETGLYYLRSRYYNPSVCRFINRDSIIIKGSLLKSSLWIYCDNSPIMHEDANGMFFIDREGLEILAHWLAGTGETLVCDSDAWSEYMRNCSETNELACELIYDTYYDCIATPGETVTKTITQPAELSANGVTPCGYKYLHGTLTFHMSIEAMVNTDNTYYFSVHCEWEDEINPNLNYKADRNWSRFAKNFATPKDYKIHIIWNLTIQNFGDTFLKYRSKRDETKNKKNSRWF